MTEQETHDWTTVMSIRELVQPQLDSRREGWNLAQVQRDEVWDQVRMRHLVDSLLVEYPIGSILLCQVRESSVVIHTQGGERVAQDAAAGEWQLLDGQQRLNALASVFTTRETYGHFYLDVSAERAKPGPVQTRSRKDRALGHLPWTEGYGEDFEQRPRCIDLSGWAEWAERDPELQSRSFDPASAQTVLREIDPDCSAEFSPEQSAIAATWLERLASAWTRPSVPVLRSTVTDPMDVLEVYTRINLGGVQVNGPDVFFAAIKTFWREAEDRLARLEKASPFLRRRYGAMRFLARLARRGLGQGDPIALNVEALVGAQGDALKAAMSELTSPGSPALKRLSRFSEWMTHRSELGVVLGLVTWECWDDVLGWAAASSRSDDAWYEESRAAIEGYLLGASLLTYRSVLGDRFHRQAFNEALVAGADGQPFPLERIAGVTRAENGLVRNRYTIRTFEDGDDREAIARASARLLTCLAQRIPYQSTALIDWDHIYPANLARRMWHPEHDRRTHHPDRWRVHSAGNLWALDASANRSIKDKPPREKFALLRAWVAEPGRGIWPRERWSLSEDEIESFSRVGDLLDDRRENIHEGMQVFVDVVASRTQRLLDEALERFPSARLLDPGSAIPPLAPAMAESLMDALDLDASG